MSADEKIFESFQKGETRALSRLISWAENQDLKVAEILSRLYTESGKARVIGVTGPPGAGKSSLINLFVKIIREEKKKVAVIAVDPMSPFTGGALLGDRIRLQDHFNDPGVYIRSLSTRGKLGGLSLATREVVHLLAAFGFDYILVETVGVGQSEVDGRQVADATRVALVPEWGDAVQTLKAGLLEIADVFGVHKADREGADRLATELKNVVHISQRSEVPVLTSSIQDEKTVRQLFTTVVSFLASSAYLVKKRGAAASRDTASELLENYVREEALHWVEKNITDAPTPYQFILNFSKKHPTGTLIKG